MIPRLAQKMLKESAQIMPVVALMGPRQSGKTTLVKMTFPDHKYVTLSNRDTQQFAEQDPRAFLKQYNQNVIIDEAQMAPSLFSYLQELVDEDPIPGRFILTGSQNFLLMEQVTQSLAGRVALHRLLPLSLQELFAENLLQHDINAAIWQGAYPRIYDQQLNPSRWYSDYITTYLERDVRTLKSVSDLGSFQRFLVLCASRAGQILNLSSLANDCGISVNTAKSWLSVLEASFIVYLLKPYHRNFNKRTIKSPKIYFYDTGLVCALLGIQSPDQLNAYPLRGELFETLIVSEIIKQEANHCVLDNIYYWRDKTGHEIDLLVDQGSQLLTIEIKSSQTMQESYLKNLKWFSKNVSMAHDSYLVYGGDRAQNRSDLTVLAWFDLEALLKKVT